MANRNAPSGFLPAINLDGSGGPKVEYLPLLPTNVAIGVGDPVTIAAGGVDKAPVTTALCGIAAEAKAANAGAGQFIAVWSDPNQLFVAQTDDGTGVLTTAADMRKNANIVVGAPSNGRSIAEIDESSGAVTATLPLKVVRLSNDVGNALGEFNRLVVRINNHQFSGGTGTAGLAT